MKILSVIVSRTLVSLLLMSGAAMLSTANAEEETKQKGDFVRGAQSWADNCMRCHHIRDPKELSDEQWITTSFHMRIRAGLTGQEVRDIIEFLQTSN